MLLDLLAWALPRAACSTHSKPGPRPRGSLSSSTLIEQPSRTLAELIRRVLVRTVGQG